MEKMNNPEKKIKTMIDEHDMISGDDAVLVALSGGSDSCALLHYLTINYPPSKIYAAHLNHMIRGGDADSDERFVKDLCVKENIKLFAEKINVPEIAKNTKKTLEEAARDERYAFFGRVCNQIGGGVKIATAHNASDNTETVIFNMSRGGGTSGLSGIAPKNGNIIRPMLSCTKDEILEYCEKNNINYIEDKTNADERYTRNFIRHSIAKTLRSRFSKLDENIFKMTVLARADAEFIDKCAAKFMRENRIMGSADIALLLSADRAVRSRVLIKMCGVGLEYKHVEYIEKMMYKGKNGRINLPKSVTVEISYGRIFIRHGDTEQAYNYNIEIFPDGTSIGVSGLSICAYMSEANEKNKGENINVNDKTDKTSENVYNLFNHAYIDFDKIIGRIYIRNRNVNDRYIFFGQTKSVKKNYINYKIPAGMRDKLPVLYDGGGIIWACGLPVCDRAKATGDTKKIMVVEVSQPQQRENADKT